MSTPPSAPNGDEPALLLSARRGRAEAWVFVLVGVVTLVLSVGLVAIESSGSEADLRLVSTGRAAPGRPFALRAFAFVPSPGRPGEVESVEIDVALALTDERDRTVARGRLVPSAGEGMEGIIDVPRGARGIYFLRARAEVAGESEPLEAAVRVRVLPGRADLAPRGRAMHPLEQYQAGPIEPAPSLVAPDPATEAPSVLDLRVSGGGCVPERRCELLVHVGDPRARIRLETRGPVEAHGECQPSVDTDAIVRCAVTVHGPEPAVVVVASRNGVDVAQRSIRLPLVLAGVALSVEPSFGSRGLSPRVSWQADEERPIYWDVYRDGIWEHASSAAGPPRAGHSAPSLPCAPLDEGLFRIQLRQDPWGVDSAGVRLVYVHEASASDGRALRELARELRALGDDDPWIAAMPHRGVAPAEQAAFASAFHELDVVPLPEGVSSRAQADVGYGERRAQARIGAAVAFALMILLVTATVLRRGLVATTEARAVLLAAGDVAAASRRRRWAALLMVLAVATAVGLVLAAAAVLVIVRGV